jgi:hypothetical protein
MKPTDILDRVFIAAVFFILGVVMMFLAIMVPLGQ